MKRLVAVLLGASLALAVALSASAASRHANATHVQKAETCIRAALVKEALAIKYLKEGRVSDLSIDAQVLHPALEDLKCAVEEARKAYGTDEISRDKSSHAARLLSSAQHTDYEISTPPRESGYDFVRKVWIQELEAANGLKEQALALLETATAPPPTTTTAPCVIGYPAPVAAGESTISLTGCKKEPTEIDITLPSAVKKATPWGVESSKGVTSGTCTMSASSLECKLNAPMPTTSTFVVAFAPALVPLEVVGITFKYSGGSMETHKYTVPPPEVLHANVTAAATTPSGSPPGTVFIVTLKVSAPIEAVTFDAVPGNSWYVAAVGGLSNMLACGPRGTQYWCIDTTHPIAPAGTYHVVLAFKKPVAAGTKIRGHITAGPGPLHGFIFTTH